MLYNRTHGIIFFFLISVLGFPFHLISKVSHGFLSNSPHYHTVKILEEDVISPVVALNMAEYRVL